MVARPSHPQQLANFGHRFVLLQVQGLRRLRFGERFLREAFGPTTLSPPRPGSRESGLGALAANIALKLGQRGAQVEHEPALGRGRIRVVL